VNSNDGIDAQECAKLKKSGVYANEDNGSENSKPRGNKQLASGSDVIVIDDDELQKQSLANNSSDGRVVKNPYKKQQSNYSAAVKNSEQNTDRSNGEMNVAEESRDARPIQNPYKKKRKTAGANSIQSSSKQKPKGQPRKAQLKNPLSHQRELQAGLVFEEDVDHIQHNLHSDQASASLKQSSLGKKSSSAKRRASKGDNCSSGEGTDDDSRLTSPSSARAYAQHQFTTRLAHNLPPILYHDPDFVAGCPATIDGSAKSSKSDNQNHISIAPPKCRCRPPRPSTLSYSSKVGPNYDRPFYCCQKGRNSGCNFFSWAFTSHMIHWYRFGPHNGHVLVKPNRGYSAEDLVQGKVGDCWFLSALAVVAERDDLIGRLIGSNSLIDGGIETKALAQTSASDNYGVIEVKLFVDGYWKTVVIDDFLPCLIDQQSEKEEEGNIQLAVRQSLEDAGIDPKWHTKTTDSNKKGKERQNSSKFDRNSISDSNRRVLNEIHEFLDHHRYSKDPSYRSNPRSSFVGRCSQPLDRNVLTSDLAYSKARHNQLWVPFVEKAYAKIHGSYRAISGGHVEEAFLDLTGAPTAVYNFDHQDFNPRHFWSELVKFRSQRLPMGCGTSTSQGGIVGMHAYSILDVREVRNVGLGFFRDKLAQGILGNVSGFTELDGTVRLLRIRNPHGQGEWKGEFSDKSPVWERLIANKNVSWNQSKGMVDLTAPQSPELKRTMVNDGTFWIDYDSFLMGFSNVDVVLAFQGNHAKSFGSSFPIKTSNHRCTRAFELSVIGRQPGEEVPNNESVEVYVMIIQKTRRGASLGRADRKKSYKTCDVGILVGELSNTKVNGQVKLGAVDGRFFGMNRNGHIRLVLDRSQPDKKLIVMPVSFGHPSATDEERSFVVRVVSDSPLLFRELPTPPNMNDAMQKFLFGKVMSLSNAGTSRHVGTQRTKTVLMECMANKTYLFKILRIDCLAAGGGTILFYLIVNDERHSQMNSFQKLEEISFSIEINCRGMVCRTTNGLVNHEVISKGKKFEAAWRRFSLSFTGENKSRLLAAVVQGGQDFQMGSIKCSSSSIGQAADSASSNGPMSKYINSQKCANPGTSKGKQRFTNYEEFGLYASVDTPSNILKGGCIDLSSTLQNTNKHYEKQTAPMEILYPDSAGLPGIDQNLDAAIMASIMETQGGGSKENNAIETPSSFAQDIEKAIALSLKD